MRKYKALEKIKIHPIVKKIWIFTSIIIGILIGILFLPWQQTIKGVGVVIAYNPTERNYYILAPISGFVKKYYVQEDQFVKKGDLIAEMVDLDKKYMDRLRKLKDTTEKEIEVTKNEIEVLEKKLENLRRGLQVGLEAYRVKLKQIENKIKALELKRISLQKNYEVAKANYERVKALYQKGIEARRKFEMEENKFVKAKVDLEKISIDLEVERNNLELVKREMDKFVAETEAKIRSTEKELLSARNKLNKYSKELVKVKSQLGKYKNAYIYAEKDGYIVRILKNDKNQFIKKGDKLILFAPKTTKRAVLLKVSSFDMPLVKKGLPVRIQFYGWPTLHISGWPKIQYGTFGGIIDKVDPVSYEKGYYYAYVIEDPNEPWPPPDTLRIGTEATCWVRLSTVPIWYEIWRRLNAFPPKMVNPPQGDLKK
jgi:multidrug efflux pump subunit AcrA (membrane-fusion protein)